jgi:ribonuclease BN (tRNA processing enzyme)
MRLTVIGSGDAFHSGGMLHSCNLLEHAGGALMLECGTGALAGVKKLGIDPNAPDAVLISHYHGDHFGGLPFFFLEYLFASPRTRPLVILGPVGVKDRVLALYENMYRELLCHELTFGIEWVDIRPGDTFEAAGFRGTAFQVLHNAAPFALGYRLECDEGKILFSGDSGWTESFVEHSADVDLFLCECCSMEKMLDIHTSYEELLENRSRLGCKRLLLTHLSEDVRAAGDLEIELAQDGTIIDI